MWSLSVEYEDFVEDRQAKQDPLAGIKLERQKVKIPKPKIRPPNAVERACGVEGAVKDRYFTAASGIDETNQHDVHKDASPFKYPADLEEFSHKVLSKAWRDIYIRSQLKQAYNERQSYKTLQKTDLLNRLWVKEPDIKNIKTVLDLDQDFFRTVEGRPNKERMAHHEYLGDLRDVMRTKITIGYREDEILLIEENLVKEQKEIERIRAEFQKYVNTFEEFLFTDHTNSMNVLRQAEQQALVATERWEQYRELSKEYGSLKSSVYNLEEKWRNCKMYQKFLYLISPMEWRVKFDYYHIRRRPQTSDSSIELEDERSNIFGRYKLASTGDVLSLDNLIDQFLDDIRLQDEPTIYFKEPSELLKVFTFIELQNLNALLHVEELAIPLENVKEGMSKMTKKFHEDIVVLQELIDSLEGGIVWEEQRAKYLEQLARELINGDFKMLISHEDIINLYVFVEDVYETRIAMNDSNMTMGEMMETIEKQYREYLLQLDRLPSDIVNRAETECYAEERRIMAVANEAAKKVVQVERLMKHLARLLEPPVPRTTRELKWRSAPRDKRKKPPPPPKALTGDDFEHLYFFTEFCEHTDNPEDYGLKVHKSQTTLHENKE